MGSIDELVLLECLKEAQERRLEFHENGYVPRDFVARLKEAGVFAAATPRAFGGDPLSVPDFLRLVERISQVDGSTGWVASFASALTFLGALPTETLKEVFADGPSVVFAGGMFPLQAAEVTAKGYLLNGRWKYVSGVMGADLIGVGIPGEPDGRPTWAIVRPEQVQIVEEWDVGGLRASGSFDVQVQGVEVYREWTFPRGGSSNIDEPLYRYPVLGYQAQVHAAVALGVAGAALRWVEEAGTRTGVTGAPPLATRAYYRIEVARARAHLRSARSWLLETAEVAWNHAVSDGDVPRSVKADIRLSSAYMADAASAVVNQVCSVAGTGVIFRRHPLHILRQDSQVPQLHASLGQGVYDAAGAVIMGQDPVIPSFP